MKYLGIAVAAVLTFNAGHLFAKEGDTVTVGSVEAPTNLTASFVNNANGLTYHLFLEAKQNSSDNKGATTIGLRGHGITICSIHGPSADLYPNSTSFGHGGNAPFATPTPTTPGPQCGTASNQTVKIDGCTALIQAHGFTHSDAPNVNYWGSVTLDVRYMRKPGNPAADRIEINVYTPKEPVRFSGKVTGGTIAMPGCTGRGDDD